MAFGDTVGGDGRTGTDHLRPARSFGQIPFMEHPFPGRSAGPLPDRLRIEAELAAYYDHEAEDRERRPLSDQRLEAHRRFLAEIDMSLPVLEVGTGTGRDVKEFVAADLSVVGIDLSLEQARRARAAGAHQVIASARSLPFRDNSFSALWSMSTLMHVPNSAIRETLVEVRPGARTGSSRGRGCLGRTRHRGLWRIQGTSRA